MGADLSSLIWPDAEWGRYPQCAPPIASASGQADGLRYCWPCDPGYDASRAAEIVSGAHASVLGAAPVPLWGVSTIGRCMNFSGGSTLMSSAGVRSVGPFTFSAFVLLRGDGAAYYSNILLLTGNDARQLYVKNGSKNLAFYSGGEIDSGIAVPVNRWTHLAISYVAGTAKFYFDGLLRRGISGVTIADGAGQPAEIGGHFVGATPYGNTNGTVGDVRIYNRALMPSEILEIAKFPGRLFEPGIAGPFCIGSTPAPAIIAFSLSASAALSAGAIAPAHVSAVESATAAIQAAALARAVPVAEAGAGVVIHAAAAADAQGAVAMAAEAAMTHAPKAPAAPGFSLTASAQVAGSALARAMPAATTLATAILTAGVQAKASPVFTTLVTARLVARGPVLSATYPALLKSGRARLTRLDSTAQHAVQLTTRAVHV